MVSKQTEFVLANILAFVLVAVSGQSLLGLALFAMVFCVVLFRESDEGLCPVGLIVPCLCFHLIFLL